MRNRLKGAFLTPLVIMFMIALGVQIVLFLFPFAIFETWNERGQFGDSFGFVSAIFSGFALCGVIYSLSMQIRDQSRQRRDARKKADAQTEPIKQLAETLKEQTKVLQELRALLQNLNKTDDQKRNKSN
jgi:hypothetical protein